MAIVLFAALGRRTWEDMEAQRGDLTHRHPSVFPEPADEAAGARLTRLRWKQLLVAPGAPQSQAYDGCGEEEVASCQMLAVGD